MEFNRIGSFEIFGMKFGADSDRFKKKGFKKGSIAHDLLTPGAITSVMDVEKALVTVSGTIIPKVVSVRTELPFKKVLGRLNKIVPLDYDNIASGSEGTRERTSIDNYSYGSGFLISWDGYVVTGAHLVNSSKNVVVTLYDKRIFVAEIVGIDVPSNVAVLKIKVDKAVDPISFGESEKLKVGQMVVSVGMPPGLNGTVASGIVSAVPRTSFTLSYQDDFIQTSTPVYLSSSGGPVVDLDGKVVGMNAAPLNKFTGVGFVVPSSLVKNIVNQIIKNKKVMRSWLGAGLQKLSVEIADTFEYKFSPDNPVGVLVNYVRQHSPSGLAGFKVGDIILSVNDEEMNEVSQLVRTVSLIPFGTEAKFKLFRNGSEITRSVEFDIEKGSEMSEPEVVTGKPGWAGIKLGKKKIISDDGRSVDDVLYIISVARLSPADQAGMKRGDIILAANGEKAASVDSYNRQIELAEEEDGDDARIRYLVKRKAGSSFSNIFAVVARKNKEEK